MAAVWLGEIDRAFDHLDDALDERDAIVYAITTWPTAAPLRDDRRCESILRRLGLPLATDQA
jgi:hypothetical protein